ncbi:MAG: sulfotransferase [Geminicoccaceae bacterium]
MVLPTFLGIGAARAGSTWLDQTLRSHQAIYLPERRKELMFFDRHFDEGIDWYERCFAASLKTPCSAIGEISPRYFAQAHVPGRVYDIIPACRFLLILRDPIDRTYSEYKYMVQAYGETRDFLTFCHGRTDAVDESRYDRHLETWFEWFPRERFCILIFEDVMAEPAKAFDALAAFLGVSVDGFSTSGADTKVNASFMPRFRPAYTLAKRTSRFLRHQNVDWAVDWAIRLGARTAFSSNRRMAPLGRHHRTELAPFFAGSVDRTERLLQCDLSAWRAA